MKALKSVIAVLFFSAIFTACKKDEVKQPTPAPSGGTSLQGKWVGKYGYGSEEPNTFFSFNIKADGTMEELNSYSEVSGVGTWVRNGNTFSATHHYLPPYTSVFISSATFDSITKKLTGTWKYSTGSSSAGKWYMNKN